MTVVNGYTKSAHYCACPACIAWLAKLQRNNTPLRVPFGMSSTGVQTEIVPRKKAAKKTAKKEAAFA